MSRGRRAFHWLAGGYALLDAIRRILIIVFGRPQPIEWWLLGADVAIVLLIIWLDVPEKWHKRRLRKIVASLIPYMSEGREIERDLHEVAATSGGTEKAAYAWSIKADFWSKTTSDFLALHSTSASDAFLLVMSGAGLDRHIYSPKYGPQYLQGATGACYQMLVSRLDNLRRIIEKPEAYF